jgi:hypothetical protein
VEAGVLSHARVISEWCRDEGAGRRLYASTATPAKNIVDWVIKFFWTINC